MGDSPADAMNAGCEGEDYVVAMRVKQGRMMVLQMQCNAVMEKT